MLSFTDDNHFFHYNILVQICLVKIRQLSKDRCFSTLSSKWDTFQGIRLEQKNNDLDK